MKLPAPNFHKNHLPPEQRAYCLGDWKLSSLLKILEAQSALHSDSRMVIPFGGPGSMTHFFDYHEVSTIAVDTGYYETYDDPYEQLRIFRDRYPHVIAKQNFERWDATKLPMGQDSQDLAVVVPPFGVNCDLNGRSPLDLPIASLRELSKVLRIGGPAYYIVPKAWIRELLQAAASVRQMSLRVLNESISRPDSRLPLSLIRAEKQSN